MCMLGHAGDMVECHDDFKRWGWAKLTNDCIVLFLLLSKVENALFLIS